MARLTNSCHTKCIQAPYSDSELSKGESVCIDRCVAKFFHVNKRLSEVGGMEENGLLITSICNKRAKKCSGPVRRGRAVYFSNVIDA